MSLEPAVEQCLPCLPPCRRRYLLSLQDEVAQSQERLAAAVQQYAEELDALDALVGSKTSVPKEQVRAHAMLRA